MKKLLLTLTVVTVSAMTMYGQGRIEWNNYSGGLITVGIPNQGPSGGAAGALLGADLYSVQLLWAPGTLDAVQWAAAVKSSSGAISMFPGSVTGSDGSDAAGYYDYASIPATPGNLAMGAAGTYTVQLEAWYSLGFSSYALSALGGKNVGLSALGTVVATASPTLPNALGLQAFTVTAVPEPTTLALAGLGLASLLIFRRRKS